MAAEKDGESDEQKLEFAMLEFVEDDVVLRVSPGVRDAETDGLTGDDGCVGTCFSVPVSSMR